MGPEAQKRIYYTEFFLLIRSPSVFGRRRHWARARARPGLEKERQGLGPGQARARAAEKERHLYYHTILSREKNRSYMFP